MSAAVELDRDGAAGNAGAPHVFSRIVGVPAGAPWEQTRAAQLEARHGSPLPPSELSWRIRRLERWIPGRAARFVIFYVRTRELTGPFETTLEVEGSPLKVGFGSAGEQLRRARRLGLVGGLAGTFAAVVGFGVVTGWQARVRTETQLGSLERTAEAQMRRARTLRNRRSASRELKSVLHGSAPLTSVIQDFAWAADAKTPDARIDAVHWDHGLLAIEARGEVAPVSTGERHVERARQPVRPGVWLWGIRTSPLSTSSAP
jgi:hypothetical protein